VVAAIDGTTSPSDSLSTRRRFTFGLSPPPSPDVGRRGGPLLFRVELSSRALPPAPEASCVSPATDAVCCLRRDMIGSASFSPFGFLSLEAAGFTLSHWARDFAPLRTGRTSCRGLSTLRSGVEISLPAWSLLRGAPALTAAGLPPASLTQHLDRTVQTRPRSGRTIL